MANISDLLAAESLLFAVVGVVFSVWYPDINQALHVQIPEHLEDAGPQRRAVRIALVQKALPLALADALVLIVFLPDTVSILSDTVGDLADSGFSAFADYNAVHAAFVVVTLLNLALACYLATLVLQLNNTRRTLQEP